MEGSRKWNNKSNELQYLHQVKIRQLCVEDFRDGLEEYFGDRKKNPAKLQLLVKKGEKEINNCIKVLKMADRVSWAAVNKYQADPLCDGDEDNRKWKQAVKEAKEEKDKKSSYSSRRDRRRSPVRYGGRDSYGSRDRRYHGGRSDGRYESRYGKAGKELVGHGFAGERTGRVTHVGRRDISERTVESGRTPRSLD